MIKQEIAVTVDSVVFYKDKEDLEVLLIRRKNEPYKNKWALPGGFLEKEESLEDGAKRELTEETGLQVEKMEQVMAFGAVNRDPRGRTISVAFVTAIRKKEGVKGADDASEAEWFSMNKLPELAFDHLEILNEALARLTV